MGPGGLPAEIYTCSSAADKNLRKSGWRSFVPLKEARACSGRVLETGQVWPVGNFLRDPFEQSGGAGRGLLPSHTSIIQVQLSRDFIPLVQLLIKLRTAA